MPVPLDVVVGLGSNLGDRLGNLRAAVADLGEVYEVRARSTVYETAPVGPPQPDYLNAAVRLRALGDLEEVLHVLLVIERRHGRTRIAANRWGARTVDLDILWAGSVVVDTPSLTVPHPRLVERAFALRPLLDVAPDAVDPRTGALFVKPAVGGDVRETELAW